MNSISLYSISLLRWFMNYRFYTIYTYNNPNPKSSLRLAAYYQRLKEDSIAILDRYYYHCFIGTLTSKYGYEPSNTTLLNIFCAAYCDGYIMVQRFRDGLYSFG
eukprot:521229_1